MKSSVVWRSIILQQNIQTMHIEELHGLYASPNTITVIKQRRMARFEHASRMSERIGSTVFWWANLRERGHLGDPGVDAINLLKWILKKNIGGGWDVDWMDVVV